MSVVLRMKGREMRERELASQRAKEDAEFAKDVLTRFNKSKTKTLKYDEIRSWLTSITQAQRPLSAKHAPKEMDHAFPGSSTALLALHSESDPINLEGQEPESITDDELQWVIKMAMDQNEKGSFKKKVKDIDIDMKTLELQPCEFGGALVAWLSYIHNKPTLNRVMKKYGINDRGQMERSQIISMLQDLSGRVPEESEVDWVMAEATALPETSGISGPELMKVLSLWYVRDIEREHPRLVEAVHHENCGSASCRIS